MLKKFWGTEYFVHNFVIPMVVLVLYCLSYNLIVTNVLMSGVNPVFTNRMWKYTLIVTVIVCVGYIVALKLRHQKINKLGFKYSIGKFHAADLLLLFLPFTPISQYIIKNQDLLPSKEMIVIILFFLLFSSLYMFIIPVFNGNAKATRTLMILGTAFAFTIFSMPLFSQQFAWYEWGRLTIQLPIFAGVFLAMWFLYNLNYRWILYFLICLVFVSNSTSQYLSTRASNAGISQAKSDSPLLSLVNGKKPVNTPNIYLLVYDSYVSSEVMKEYGIDNSSQEKILSTLGFKLYPDVYSVGSGTARSMNKVFELSNETSGETRVGISGDGIVQHLLKSIGYKTYGVFPSSYQFRKTKSSYDYSYPERGTPIYIQIISGVLIGEFRFDLHFQENSHEDYVNAKLSVLENMHKERAFIYTHTNIPEHSQNSGGCLTNETQLYEERLQQANIEMQKDIKTVIENDPGAIIIVAGDHGPYLTKNCYITADGGYDISEIIRLDIQDRFGAFLAIKWPNGDFEKYDNISVLQDIFPAVFAYLYEDENILEAKITPNIESEATISGASVIDGIIHGGQNDNEPLYLPTE